MPVRTLWLGALALIAGASGVSAQGVNRPWIVTVGLWSIGKPAFAGSEDLEFAVKPILNVRREGDREPLHLPSDHGGPALFRSERLRIGPSFNFESERKASDHAALSGLDNVPWTFEGGAFVEYWPGPGLRARAELRRGFNGHEGLIANLSADVILKPDDRWTFTIGPRLAIADAAYMQAYFGVTPGESVASGLRAFDPKGGLYSAGVGGSAKFQWSASWAMLGYVQVDRLLGDAQDSPITALGSDTLLTIGLGMTYTTRWDHPMFWER
jgi:outer membrane protein